MVNQDLITNILAADKETIARVLDDAALKIEATAAQLENDGQISPDSHLRAAQMMVAFWNEKEAK